MNSWKIGNNAVSVCTVAPGLAPAKRAGFYVAFTSMLAAVAIVRAAVGAHGIAIGSEAALRLDAPVRRRRVLVVARELVGIRSGRHIHAFVPQVQAVHARR